MVFLRNPYRAAGRRHHLLHPAACAAFLFAGTMMLAGCGGSDSVTPPPVTPATVRGRLIDSTFIEPIAGITLRLGDATATTDANGVFVLQTPGGGDARRLLIELPADEFHDDGSYAGSSCVKVREEIVIAKTDLESGDSVDIGEIGVTRKSSSPPGPPCDAIR